MIGNFKAALLSAGLACVCAAMPASAQTPGPATPAASEDHASAYYNFAMAHLYAEMAGAYGNRGEYVNKAIDYYKLAMKADPTAHYIEEELTDFYVQTGQLEKATQEAEGLLKANPNNGSAHKVLARIYSRQIGDPDQGKVDQTMLKNAIAEYQKASDLDPKDNESFSMLARLSRVNHDDATAEKAYRRVLELDPDDEDALNGLALVYADKGDFAGAVEMLKKAVEKNPEPRNVVMLAQFYDQAKDFQHGADAWKQAVDLTNGNTKVMRQYATDLYAAGRFDEALKALQDLAVADPKDDKLELQIAELLRNKHDYDGAAAALAKAKAISNTPEVRFAEAELMNTQGKHAEAIAAMQKLLGETKKDTYNQEERRDRLEMLDRLGNYQLAAGKANDAVASYHEIGEIDPTLGSKVAVTTVEALQRAKEFKAARQEADAAMKKYPGDRQVILIHALLLGDLGQTDIALNELKTLPNWSKDREVLLGAIAPIQDKAKRFEDEKKTLDSADTLSKTPQEKSAVDFVRGAMYEREKNFDAAEKSFRRVLDSDANNAGAMNYLGYMFADRGVRLDEAKQLISKALDIDPGNPAYLDSLAWVHYHQSQFDQAASELRDALDKMGDDPTVHEHLGDVYLKQGKIREAIQQWEASLAEYKKQAPADADPVEVSKVTKKLEGARVRVAEKTR
ncbi:MAG TPA: tetratricopeptide repeat protein [Bryobacteraceae bacterium]|nr:tetratricopeptide repeat protein [Bryobacteraceae bacterium]